MLNVKFLTLILLFVIGACLGALVNLSIYRLAYLRRRISPWSRTRGELPPRTWLDRIPIYGWWPLRREAKFHGAGFWFRPMMIELFGGLGLVGLYWWELGAFAINVSPQFPNFRPTGEDAATILQAQFAIHVVLLTLMAVATFIDFDEQTIPDSITLPGTIIALVVATFCTAPVLPALQIDPQNPQVQQLLEPLRFDFPIRADAFLQSGGSLAVALACYLTWCFALLPRRWRRDVGIAKACRVMIRRIFARPEWRWVVPLAVVGCAGIALAWSRGGEGWRGLTSALLGLAAGGGVVWIIRLASSAVMGREAMGFGDVTLMAMIGAFLGWQAAIITFFLAPLAGAVIGLIQWIQLRGNVIPFGPFLCLAALMLILFWAPIWDAAAIYFEVPWLVPSAILICLPIMAALLYALMLIKAKLAGDRP